MHNIRYEKKVIGQENYSSCIEGNYIMDFIVPFLYFHEISFLKLRSLQYFYKSGELNYFMWKLILS